MLRSWRNLLNLPRGRSILDICLSVCLSVFHYSDRRLVLSVLISFSTRIYRSPSLVLSLFSALPVFWMLFNCLWFLCCWCVLLQIQNPTEPWKGKKWEKRLRKSERGDERMCLISASLLKLKFTIVFLVDVWMLLRAERLRKDRHVKHAHWHFLIKYGNQGANQQYTICNPF